MAFGQCVEVQRGENDDIVTAARKIFQHSNEGKSTFIILIVLPLMCELCIQWLADYSYIPLFELTFCRCFSVVGSHSTIVDITDTICEIF